MKICREEEVRQGACERRESQELEEAARPRLFHDLIDPAPVAVNHMQLHAGIPLDVIRLPGQYIPYR
jgi:hypothetical protein